MLKNRLEQIRENFKYERQSEFARFLDINPKEYSNYERNERQPTIFKAYEMCKILNLKFEDIFYDTKDSKK